MNDKLKSKDSSHKKYIDALKKEHSDALDALKKKHDLDLWMLSTKNETKKTKAVEKGDAEAMTTFKNSDEFDRFDCQYVDRGCEDVLLLGHPQISRYSSLTIKGLRRF